MRAAVVGLGLIGGSLAMALKGYPGLRVTGVVRSENTLRKAVERRVCDEVTMNPMEALAGAELVWLCMPPKAILSFLEEHKGDFRPGTIVTDVCGVKTAVMQAARALPETVDFIGCHPMAGKETSKLDNAEATLFQNAHFILTPRPESDPAHVALLEDMAQYMGFRDTVRTTPEEHDAMIAYTSQLMHVMAVAVCDDAELERCTGFEGGSFRDCTRVAALDVPLWTELFSLNAPALARSIARLEDNLRAYRQALEAGDTRLLEEKLTASSGRKRKTLTDRPE
ncbi:MAG: prephenate dehydrogenase [Oscillospiraceae bacterium]|nr:prephenate dehydrogenase [Oscillospiraceae bacterium]